MKPDRAIVALLAVLLGLVAAGPWLPQWAAFLLTLALSKGLVVLGLMLLLRAGLVSFGQGLYYCLGAYTAGVLTQFYQIHDALVLLGAGTLAAVVLGALLGVLLADYRGIFFGLLSLAFSMILYGLIVKSSALGSTDGFTLPPATLFGRSFGESARYVVFVLACVLSLLAAWGLQRYAQTPLGRLAPAIRDNEIRVEYLGQSVRSAVHIMYVIAAALGGLGGALTAIAVGHIDPEMAYWTTSGEFVFMLILSGTGNVVAPFLGALLFSAVRTFAYEYSPNTWQMVLGVAMLLIIIFLPEGLWSVFQRKRARPV
jgi:ABC-type branched-subunit amino acid transport system permease subunit